MTATTSLPARPRVAGFSPASQGVWRVWQIERRKLSAQLAIRLLALVCVVGPFLFAAILKVQSGSPTDTLYGIWVHSSGFALSLVLLAFAGSWGLPLIAGIVAATPPAFIGQQQMKDAGGHSVVNPLYTIYGCFDPL
jgi:ABC-2 type transport system permease protein